MTSNMDIFCMLILFSIISIGFNIMDTIMEKKLIVDLN